MKRITIGLLSSAFCLPIVLFARSFQTGHFVMTLSDTEGHPITNATVYVKTLNRLGLAAGVYDGHYTTFSAPSDGQGVADVSFQFLTSHFDWWIETPSHHSEGNNSGADHFRPTVVRSDYWDSDTNTVDGLARFNELKALDEAGDVEVYVQKFEPKSVTYVSNTVYKSMSFPPKKNPQPMYQYDDVTRWRHLRLPMNAATAISNENVMVKHYPAVEYDMKIGRFLPPWGGDDEYDSGEVSDFKIIRSECMTNDVLTLSGDVQFAPGCGAYKGNMTGNVCFPGFYEADTNKMFISRIPFELKRVNGVWTNSIPLLSDNEYLVLRTRAVTNDVGVVTNCNYSAILGRMFVPWRSLNFGLMIFNPRSNDTNLEYDRTNNLAE